MALNKTIVLGSTKANKWLFGFSAVIFLLNAGFHVFYGLQDDPFRFVLGILFLAATIYYFFYASVGFSPNSKYSPKVRVDESTVVFRNSVWKPSKRMKWSDISTITFHSYQIDFDTKKGPVTFSYNASADVSKSIKQMIRESAEMKGIEVIGG